MQHPFELSSVKIVELICVFILRENYIQEDYHILSQVFHFCTLNRIPNNYFSR